MTTSNSSGFRTFQATAVAIGAFKRVKVDSGGLISVCTGAEAAVGVTQEAIALSGYGTVKLFNAPGTFLMCANAAITRGNSVYPANSGNITGAGNTAMPLIALEAANALGDIIEVAPNIVGVP